VNAAPPHIASLKIQELRALLADRHFVAAFKTKAITSHSSTGIPVLDEALAGGFAKRSLYEFITGPTGSGSATLTAGLLRRRQGQHRWTALVDGANSFEPDSDRMYPEMLWVRCQTALQAIKGTDLLLRDGNVELIILDLALNDPAQVNKIPSSTWFRFQRLLEVSRNTLIVLTSKRLVSSTRASFKLTCRFDLNALERNADDLLAQLQVVPALPAQEPPRPRPSLSSNILRRQIEVAQSL
jgi:hypothetical protein